MRRKQCLDWRALALLGALLAILVDWQMVYAMPMILTTLRAVTTTTTTTPSEAETTTRLPMYQTTTMYNSLQEESLNQFNIKLFNEHDDDSDNNNDDADEDDEVSNAYENAQAAVNIKKEFIENTNDSRNTNADNNDSDNNNENKYKEKQVYEQNDGSFLNNIKENIITDKFVHNNSNISNINNQKSSDYHKQLTVTSNEGEIQNTQGIKKSNQIINKRNRKRIFKNNSNVNTSQVNITKSVNDESFLISISNSVNNSVNNKQNHSNARTFVTGKTSQIKNTRTLDDKLYINSSITSKPFSSSSQSSLLHNIFSNVAILSRTERSIRGGSDVVDLIRNRNSGGIVRRSSMDVLTHSSSNHHNHHQGGVGGTLKTRRLNNSRNTAINTSNSQQHSHHNSYNYNNSNHNKSNLDRNERSTISLLSGPSRKIQLYIKNRFIQLLPDGTVNGTQDDQSEYTILQRSTVDVGRIKIQSVATCLYLCMDQCGAVFGSKDFTDDCVFNENMEQHNYNTYSSTYNSNARRIYYLALNRHGEPRKLQIPPSRSLGKLATYTNAITETVPQERVEELIAKNFGANRIKHGLRQLCDTGKPLIELIDSRNFKARPQCNPNSSSSSNSNSNSNSSSNSRTSSVSRLSSSSINSSSSSNSSSNSSNAQLLNNVPAANDKARISNANTNSSNSSQNSSSNNEHTSGSSSSSSGGGVGGKKKKKRRKCRPYENEEEHNCQPRPQALRKRGNNNKLKCQQQQQQQQQQQLQANVDGATPIPCTPKRNGPKKNNNNKKGAHNGGGRQNKKNADGVAVGPNNRKGKKRPNANKNGGNKKRGGGGGPKNGGAKRQNGQKGQNKKNLMSAMSTSTPTTTTYRSYPTTSMYSLLQLDTTTASPDRITTSIYDSLAPDGQTTSDRGEREQRNARYSHSMEEAETGAGGDGGVDADDSVADSAENSEEVDNVSNDSGEAAADDDDDTNESYEDDDATVPNNGHMPTHLTSGSEDFLYDDQLDFLPIGLWELFALLWIMQCCFRLWN